MARELRNVSGATLWVDDANGLSKVEADAIYHVADDDTRYFQTGDTGETVLWKEITRTSDQPKAATKAATKKENR